MIKDIKRNSDSLIPMAVEPNRVGQFPFPKSDPQERKNNFTEVQQSYTEEEVMREANRCLTMWYSCMHRCLPCSLGCQRYE